MNPQAVAADEQSTDARGALKLAAVVGVVNGAARLMEGGEFAKPAVQATLVAAGVGYALREYDDFVQSLAIGGAMGASCKLMQNAPLKRCLRYGLVSAVASYIALGTVALELAKVWRDRRDLY